MGWLYFWAMVLHKTILLTLPYLCRVLLTQCVYYLIWFCWQHWMPQFSQFLLEIIWAFNQSKEFMSCFLLTPIYKWRKLNFRKVVTFPRSPLVAEPDLLVQSSSYCVKDHTRGEREAVTPTLSSTRQALGTPLPPCVCKCGRLSPLSLFLVFIISL